VDHFHQDHHVIGRLHDLQVVVIEIIRHERRRRAEGQQAALGKGTILWMIVLAAAHRHLGARLLARARFLRQRGNAAIGRIDDERAATLAIDDRDTLTRIEPEIVVAADIARGAG